VLDIHSPGGSTFGVQELAAEIFAARGVKPVIAQVNSQCASAAYWLASQADEIVVTPSGEAGSIGVYTVHEDVTKAMEMAGVKATIVKGGANKTELSGLQPLSDDAREALQARVGLTAKIFNETVAQGRGVDVGVVLDRFGQGRMYDAPELLKRGMVDRVATLRETLARLGAPATVTRGAPGRALRQAFAAGEPVKLALIEEHLREGGFPDALATAFVSRGKGALRQGDPGEEAKTAAADGCAP
jgi:signal peptide peptidase SppA